MGTPSESCTASHSEELKHLSVAEKSRVFEVARVLREESNLEPFSKILDWTRHILLPLVPWLDKEIPFEPGMVQKGRAMLVLDGSSHAGFPDLMLERSGKWIVKPRQGKDASYLRMDSYELAILLSVKDEESLLCFARGEEARQLVEEVDFLRDFVLYDSILSLVDECVKTVARTLHEREERLKIMREHLELLCDFQQSLDPLRAMGNTVVLPEFSIFAHDSHGTSRCTEGYLTEEGLAPFWAHVKERRSGNYKLNTVNVCFDSLSGFVERVTWLMREIHAARSQGKDTAAALFGYTSGRLPFSAAELAELKKKVFLIVK